MSLNLQTGAAIRAERERAAVTVADLAAAMEVAVDTLYRIERGATVVTVRHIESAAKRLGKTPGGLLSAIAREVEAAAHG